jgi:RNA polymerase sigma-70 factor (ECF subfamily)
MAPVAAHQSVKSARPEPASPAGQPLEGDQARMVARLRAGEEGAFEELVRAAGGQLLAVARRMLGCDDDAQDAVQEAFLSAFKSLDRFDGRSQLTTWLHRIVVNACLMKLRSQRRRPECSIEELLPQFIEDGHQRTPSRPWNAGAASGPVDSEVRQLVRAKIEELPESYREIILLRDIEELDTEETGRVLGLSPAAVKTRLHRARQALRTLLDPYFAEPR